MASGSADEMPSSSQATSSDPNMIDQLLEEREILRSDIQRMQTDHKRQVDLVRSTLERQLQEANVAINGLRQELSKEVNINQDHVRSHESQAKKESDLKKTLVSTEDHNLRISTEKNNLLLLLEGNRSEIADLRETIRNQSRQVTESLSEAELLRLKCNGKDSEMAFLQISEKSLKAQADRLQKDVSETHSMMVKKDREISEARVEADRRVKEVMKQLQAQSDELWQERRKVATLEDNVKREKEVAQRLQERLDAFESDKRRVQEEASEQNTAQQKVIDSLKDHVAVLKRRNDQLEEENRVQENGRDELEEVYKKAVKDFQEELSSVQTELEEKTSQISGMTAELENARNLTAYLKNDASRTVSAELQNLVRGQGFSVPKLYHEYIITAGRLIEAQNAQASAQSELDRRSQEWQQYIAGRNQEEEGVKDLQRQLERSQNTLQQQNKKVDSLEKQAQIHRRNLRTLEVENRTLRDKNEVLQRQVISVVEDNDEDDGSLLDKTSYRNTSELIQVNAELYASIESLNKDNYDLKVQLEEATKNEEEFREAVDQVRGLAAQKEQFDVRLTEISREVQLYRVLESNPLFKDFLRILSSAPEQMDALLALAANESALWSFIRSADGDDIATRFTATQKEVQVAQKESQEARLEAEKRSSEVSRVRETHKADMKILGADRDRAVRDFNVLREQMDTLQRESSQRTAEVERQMAKTAELYERLCNSEKECGSLAQALENQREESGRRAAECQELRQTAASLQSRLAVFEEQQSRAQTVISQHMAAIEAAHTREVESGRKMQEAHDSLTNQQSKASILQRELTTQQSKVESVAKELTEARKHLEEFRSQQRTNSNKQPSTSSSNNEKNSQASSQYVVSVLRQSSVQQESLQQQISELQGQLEKAKGELKEKVSELAKYQESATKKSEEMQGTRYSLMSDMAHIKEEKETLRAQLNAAKSEKTKVQAERKKLEEVVKRQRGELEEQMNKYVDELQAHQVSAAHVAELRKEVDQLKQNAQTSKRRESDLQKAMDELRKQTVEQEKKLREEVRLMELERENNKEWKRTVYDRALPSNTDLPSDEVQNLTIVVEYQKKENDSIFRQLQLSKEDCFAGAAKVKFLSEGLEQVQQELQLVIKRKEGSIESDSWQKSYSEQQAILNSTMEMNAKLRMEVSSAQKEMDSVRASLNTLTERADSATSRVKELESENGRLQEAERVLKHQVQDWHNKFGVQQQKGEIETLKKRIADLEKSNGDQAETLKKLKANFSDTVTRRVQAKTKEMEQSIEETRRTMEERTAELTSLRSELASKNAEIAALKVEHPENLRHQAEKHAREMKQIEVVEKVTSAAIAALRVQSDEYKEAGNQLQLQVNSLTDSASTMPAGKVVPPSTKPTTSINPQSKVVPDKPMLTLRPSATVVSQVAPDVASLLQSAQTNSQMQGLAGGLTTMAAEAARPAIQVEPERAEPAGSSGTAGGGSAPTATVHSAPVTPPSSGLTGGIARRRVHPDSDEQPGGSQQRQVKRARPASSATAAAPAVSRIPLLRPPSPTSVTDVTSSTAPVASTHAAAIVESDRSEDRAVGSSGEAGTSAPVNNQQVEEADGVTESSMGPSPGTVVSVEALSDEAPDHGEVEAMVVDESGPSTSQPIVEEPEDEVQPAASHEASGSTDQAAEAISASLPDDGGSQEDDRATAAEMAMYSSNEAATSSASLPDQTTATALDVVLQPGHGHSRSLDDATPITDILSIIENRQEIDADTLEGILDGQGIGDGAEEGEVESEEEEEQGEGGGQEDGTGEQDVESRDTDESAPSESEVRLSVGPTVLSAGDGTALTGVPSTSQASLDSEGGATPSASQSQLAASQSSDTQVRLRQVRTRMAPSSSNEAIANMTRVSPAAPSASSSGNLGNNSPQRTTTPSTRRPISPPNPNNLTNPTRPSRHLPNVALYRAPSDGRVRGAARGTARRSRGRGHQ